MRNLYELTKAEKLHCVGIKAIRGLGTLRQSAEILAEINNNPAPDPWDTDSRVGELDVLA